MADVGRCATWEHRREPLPYVPPANSTRIVALPALLLYFPPKPLRWTPSMTCRCAKKNSRTVGMVGSARTGRLSDTVVVITLP